MARSFALYAGIVGFFIGAIWLLVSLGGQMHPVAGFVAATPAPETGSVPLTELIRAHFQQQNGHSFSVLLMQIIIILAFARFFGVIATKFGQQPVIGEIIAGIFLGPSLLGWVWPGGTSLLFPEESLNALKAISQFGLIFFMFIIGTELDLGKLKNHSRGALLISHGTIAFCFFLGVGFAYFTYEAYAPKQVAFLSFALFMGIALSITAFPVLARILRERGLSDTPLGSLVLTCAASDDLTAWCLLAGVIAIVKAGSIAGAMITFALAIGYVSFMVFLVRSQVNRWMARYLAPYRDSRIIVSGVFLVLLISSFIAEVIGIHALFGAFTAGVVMSEQTELKEALREKLEDISVLVLLPIFFAFTGLRTQIGLLDTQMLWILCGVVSLLAVLGKFGGASLITKLTGRPWRDSLSVGALMNTRGLMELIVLNIGYDLGILSPQIFAMLVIMALATTFMTGPLMYLIDRFAASPAAVSQPVVKHEPIE